MLLTVILFIKTCLLHKVPNIIKHCIPILIFCLCSDVTEYLINICGAIHGDKNTGIFKTSYHESWYYALCGMSYARISIMLFCYFSSLTVQ